MATSVVLGIVLVVSTCILLILAACMQWKLGSSLHQTELETLDYERRNIEMTNSIEEMRHDISSKQEDWEKVGAMMADDQAEGLEKSVRSEAKSVSNEVAALQKQTIDGIQVSKIDFLKPLYPCYVISIKNLRSLDRLCTHEQALKLGLLEVLSSTSRRPSCKLSLESPRKITRLCTDTGFCALIGALTYFISQNWESTNHPDNDKNVRLLRLSLSTT